MKKIAMLLGLVASCLLFVGCAAKNADQELSAKGSAHKDMKGEVNASK